MNLTLQHRGDYGNPSGTGAAKLMLTGLPNSSDSAQAAVIAKQAHESLVNANVVDTLLSAVTATVKVANLSPAKPGTGVNTDVVCVVSWIDPADRSRLTTLPCIDKTSSYIVPAQAGDRLNQAGRDAVARAIESLYGYTSDTVRVRSGIIYQKR